MNFINKLKRTLVILLLPIMSYLVLGPLEIYMGNKKEFVFDYTEFFGAFILIAIIVWMVGAILIALLPEKVNKFFIAAVLGLGVASYIQNMFMNTKLSEADGGLMDWASLGVYPIINTIVYIIIILIVIGLCIVLKDNWENLGTAVAGFLSVIQLVAVVSLVLTAGVNTVEEQELQVIGNEQYKVAEDKNIIVFVLDTYGSTQLESVFTKYPDAKDILKDFTYFDNADCHYYTTFPSMTHMLTGVEFDFYSGSEKWLENAWNADRTVGFYNILEKKDFTCNLYSGDYGAVYGDLSNLVGKFDNIRSEDYIIDTFKIVTQLCKMSTYRYVPYLIKPYFEVLTYEFGDVVQLVEGKVAIHDNADYYTNLKENRLEIDEKMSNAFIIQHLFGTHVPYTIDANGNKVEKSSVDEVGRGLLTILEEYFNQLKAIGKYEDSVIIVTADHGSWSNGDPQPIFFIKEAGESHGEMLYNSAPISFDDFQATILDVLEEEYSEYGYSIYDWEKGQQRERSVYMIGRDFNYPDIPGSSINVYYKYTYFLNKEELIKKIELGPDDVLPATTWGIEDSE